MDFRSDQFSFGSILYEMVTRQARVPGQDADRRPRGDRERRAATDRRAQSQGSDAPALDRGAVSGQGARQPLRVDRGSGPRPRHDSGSPLRSDLGIRGVARRQTGASPASGLDCRGCPSLLAAGIGYVLAIKTSRVKAPQYTPDHVPPGNDHVARGSRPTARAWCTARPGRESRSSCIRLDWAIPNPSRSDCRPRTCSPLRAMETWRSSWIRSTGGFSTSERWRAPRLAEVRLARYRSSCRTPSWGPSGQLALLRVDGRRIHAGSRVPSPERSSMRSIVQRDRARARPLPGCNPPGSRRTDGSLPSSSIR